MANRRGKLSILIEAKNLAGKAFLQVKSQARDMAQSTAAGAVSMGEKIRGAIFSVRGLVTGFAALAALRIGRRLFEIGSVAEETGSKYRTVFGPAVQEVNEFLEDFHIQAGLTVAEMQEIVATTGAIVQGFGATKDEAAAFSTEITKVAADLASFNNVRGGTAEVSRALQAALAGEREQIKRYGIVLREEDVVARALLDTNKQRAQQLTTLERAQATLTLITEKAGVAIGDLDRTQSSAANTARRVAASYRQVREEIATSFLPLMGQLVGTLDENSSALFAISGAVRFLLEQFALATAEVRIFGARMAQVWVGFPGLVRTAAGDALVELSNFVRKADPLLSALGIGLAGDLADRLLETGDDVFASGEQAIRSATIAFNEAREEILLELGRSLGESGGGAVPDVNLPERTERGTEEAADRLKKIREAGIETGRALDLLAVKSDLLGDAFDPTAERAKILGNAINAFTDAGLEADDVIPGLGRTLSDVSFEYRTLTGDIEAAEIRQKRFADDQQLIASLLASTETEAEKYASIVERLNDAYASGTITQAQFTEGLDAARDAFERGATDLEDRARVLSENVSRGVQEAMTGGLTELGESVGGLLANTGEQMTGLGDVVTATMGGLMKTIGQSLIAFGTAGVAIKKFIANPFAAIAAGVALVALGSALTSSVQAHVNAAGSSLAGGGAGAGGATATAGAGIDRDLAGRQGDLTLVFEGGTLFDMSDPKTERAFREALEEASGRRVTTVVRRRT